MEFVNIIRDGDSLIYMHAHIGSFLTKASSSVAYRTMALQGNNTYLCFDSFSCSVHWNVHFGYIKPV
jgi:hypothetical protein